MLNDNDSQNLLNLLTELNRAQGLTCIIISHKLHELTQISDRITVIRDGQTIETMDKGDESITEEKIIKNMVGRQLTNRFPVRTPKIGEIAFEVKNVLDVQTQDTDGYPLPPRAAYLTLGFAWDGAKQ